MTHAWLGFALLLIYYLGAPRPPFAHSSAGRNGIMSEEQLLSFARTGNDAGLRRLLNKDGNDGLNVNVTDCDGLSALLLAVKGAHRGVVQLLLDARADTEVTDSDENTALLVATQQRNVSIVRLLLRKEADIDAANFSGRTALMIAASAGDIALVRHLLHAGADVDAIDNDGKTALKLAKGKKQDHERIIQLIRAEVPEESESSSEDEPKSSSEREKGSRRGNSKSIDPASSLKHDRPVPSHKTDNAPPLAGKKDSAARLASKADILPPPPYSPAKSDSLALWKQGNMAFSYTLKGNDATFSPTGYLLASGIDECQVGIWKPETGELVKTLSGHTKRVVAVAFTPDALVLASYATDGIRIWNVSTGDHIKTLSAAEFHSYSPTALAFSPSGKLLASGAEDNTTKVWRWDTNQGVLSLGTGSKRVARLAFSHNSERLATGSYDGPLKLWNPNNGELVGSLEGHTMSICGLAYSNDGALLVVCIMKPLRLLPWSKKGMTDETLVTSRPPLTVPCRSGRQTLEIPQSSAHSTWAALSQISLYLQIQDCLPLVNTVSSLRYMRQPPGD